MNRNYFLSCQFILCMSRMHILMDWCIPIFLSNKVRKTNGNRLAMKRILLFEYYEFEEPVWLRAFQNKKPRPPKKTCGQSSPRILTYSICLSPMNISIQNLVCNISNIQWESYVRLCFVHNVHSLSLILNKFILYLKIVPSSNFLI